MSIFVEFPKYIKHPERLFPKRIARDEEEETAILKEWGVLKEDVELALDNYRDTLLKKATKLEIKIDNRWSDIRLKRAVEEAEEHA